MSVTKVQRSNDITAATIYAVYGTRSNARQGLVRADAVTVFNSGSSDPLTAAQEWLDELRKNPELVNEAQIIIQSFHPDELSKHKRANVELGHFAGSELARRLEAEGVFFINATHTDSRSGHVHNHIIIPNFLPDSGKTPRNARNRHAVKRVNDQIMKELGLSVIEPQQQRQEITPQQRQELLAGRTTDGRSKSIHELDDSTWKHALTSRVDAVFSSDEVMRAATVDEGLQTAQDIAQQYNLSIQIKGNAKDDDKHAITFALVDDDGEVIRRHREGKREGGSRVKVAKPGSYFGSPYTLQSLQELIQQQQVQYQAEQALRALLNSHEQEEEEQNEHIEQSTAGEADQAGLGGDEPEISGAGETSDTGEQPTAIASAEFTTAASRYCVVSSVSGSIQPDSREPHPAARQLVIDRDTEQQREQQQRQQRQREQQRQQQQQRQREQQRQQQQQRQRVQQQDDWEFC